MSLCRSTSDPSLIATLSGLFYDSIRFGLDHRNEAVSYVNEMTLHHGERGRSAVHRLRRVRAVSLCGVRPWELWGTQEQSWFRLVQA